MAPLPQNNTDRLFFDYITGSNATSVRHTVQMRIAPEVTDPAASQASFFNLLSALGAGTFRSGWRVEGVRFQAAGTDFSLPLTLSANLQAFVGTGGSPGYLARFEAVEETFQGRSTTSGRRVDISLYRALSDANTNFRTGMPVAVQTALSVASGSGDFVCVDGTLPIWYTYINSNYNSYWEARVRSV